MPPVDRDLLDFAVDLAREAGDVTLDWFQSVDLVVDSKADGTPVTAADRASERLVRERLAARFPHDGILGEEEAETTGTSGRRWISTHRRHQAFTRGCRCTRRCGARRRARALGVIVLPAVHQAVYAGRGRGCWFDGAPARVSTTAALDGAYLTTSSYSHWDDEPCWP